MAQHVRMHLEADLGRDAGPLDQCGEPTDGETVRPFRKQKGRAAWPRAFNVRCDRNSSPSSGCVVVVPPLAPMRWPWCRCASSPASQEPSSSGPELSAQTSE